MTDKKTVLIFPINAPEAAEYSRIATELGFRVVEASSEFDADVIARGNVVHLPYVTEPPFVHAFTNLLQTEHIQLVYSPHPAVWNRLMALSGDPTHAEQFKVCNSPPLQHEWDSYQRAYDFGRECVEQNSLISTDEKILSLHSYASLHRGYHNIPGQCDDQKLALLTQIALQAPAGDIVEIGTLYGRSAYALAWLSKQYRLGTVICIDPWKHANISDQGHEASLVNSIVTSYDWDQIFAAFIVSTAGFENINYIREPSVYAKERYVSATTKGGRITSSEFGATPVSGRISILHVDGNHRYDEVKQDVEQWLPMIREGGWLLLDDYLWAFGDGPRRVGDELLESSKVKQSHLVGDTLCMQF